MGLHPKASCAPPNRLAIRRPAHARQPPSNRWVLHLVVALRLLPATARIFSLVTTVEGFRQEWAIEEVCKHHGWHLPSENTEQQPPRAGAKADVGASEERGKAQTRLNDLQRPVLPMPSKEYMDKFHKI